MGIKWITAYDETQEGFSISFFIISLFMQRFKFFFLVNLVSVYKKKIILLHEKMRESLICLMWSYF